MTYNYEKKSYGLSSSIQPTKEIVSVYIEWSGIDDLSYLFKDCTGLISAEIKSLPLIKNVGYLFCVCKNLEFVNLPKTYEITHMFQERISLGTLDLSLLSTTNVQRMDFSIFWM